MRILISNDDGITAPGISALVTAVRGLGEVTVVAPDSPQSASAHAISIHEPLTARRIRLEGAGGFEGIAVSGRPADCVRLAVRNLMPQRPNLVLSGINAGANVGVNVFYSGTVAAAAEGALCGIPAVAFSAEAPAAGRTEIDFAAAGRECRRVLEMLLAEGLGPRELINVNVPGSAAEGPRQIRLAEQSDADVEDKYILQSGSDGLESYRLGDVYSFCSPAERSDVALLAAGFVTVTPLRTDLTDHGRMELLLRLEGR